MNFIYFLTLDIKKWITKVQEAKKEDYKLPFTSECFPFQPQTDCVYSFDIEIHTSRIDGDW